MRKVSLDQSKLFGFRILPESVFHENCKADKAQDFRLGAKVGEKVGGKPINVTKLGAKLGGKPGVKPQV